jgi:hypothetical protein
MEYAKIAADGSVEQYPYTISQLRSAYPNVSFPFVITPADVIDFGLVEVSVVTSFRRFQLPLCLSMM